MVVRRIGKSGGIGVFGEGGIPIMKNGLNKGVALSDGKPLTEHVAKAKKRFIDNALEKLGLLLDSPTASGSAGNSGRLLVY